MKLDSFLILSLLLLCFINYSLGRAVGIQSCDLCIGNGADYCEPDYKICMCGDGYTGDYCNITTNLIVSTYDPAPQGGGYGFFRGYFKNTTNLYIKIGPEEVLVSAISQFNLNFLLSVELDQSKTYDVLVKQGSDEWFGKDFYSPLGFQCDTSHGYPYNSICYCSRAWSGTSCQDASSVEIDSLSSNVFSVIGGEVISGFGWFGTLFNTLNFTIANVSNSISINTISSTYFQGVIYQQEQQIPSSLFNSYQDIQIYNITNNQLVFTGENMIYFDSSKCIDKCQYGCINSTCSLPPSQSSSSSSSSNNSNSDSDNSDNNSSINSSIKAITSYLNINSVIISVIIAILIN